MSTKPYSPIINFIVVSGTFISGINLGIKGFIVIEVVHFFVAFSVSFAVLELDETVSRLLHLDFIEQELEMYRCQTADNWIRTSGGTMAMECLRAPKADGS
ncbi:hypothetical protein BT96DRAFT_944705 [Gymnopus androsaceus JB14]|uniref:Uncharacterized protein n=1 Tax=Gymnopus androsaceus JB14 TaxID=1447944 RepID=A0A6A4H4N6_9AGAR|nr:hypothetical protein BT96DRAFT_944705 [Gymnopus androsaceus JB14]